MERTTRETQYNIKIHHKIIECESVDWREMTQWRNLVSKVTNFLFVKKGRA
jgi:hypothetical protein